MGLGVGVQIPQQSLSPDTSQKAADHHRTYYLGASILLTPTKPKLVKARHPRAHEQMMVPHVCHKLCTREAIVASAYWHLWVMHNSVYITYMLAYVSDVQQRVHHLHIRVCERCTTACTSLTYWRM